MNNRYLLFAILMFLSHLVFSQNLFPEKFTNCNTDRFALESDSTDATIEGDYLIKTLLSSLSIKQKSKIKGEIRFQIMVDLNGRSCLISIQNETNIKSKKTNFKEVIDSKLKWEVPIEKVAAIVSLKFENQNVQMSRLGLNGKKGWHQLIIK